MLIVSQNVHEGPIGIGTRVQYTEVPIAAGNVISDGSHTSIPEPFDQS